MKDNEKEKKKKRLVIIFFLLLVFIAFLFSKKIFDDYYANRHSLIIVFNNSEYGAQKEVKINAGEEYKLEIPAREGYSFDGWSVNSKNSKLDDNVLVMGDENTTITANWEPIPYEIEYNINNENYNIDVANYTIETETFELEKPEINVTGYSFDGWFDNEELKGKQQKEIKQGTIGDKRYYAKWIPVEYSIDYRLNGGIVTQNINRYNIETNSFKLNNPTRNGYIFLGWSSDLSNSLNKNVWINKGSVGNRIFYANWVPVEYKIVYDLKGGKLINSNLLNYNIETESFRLNNPVKEHYDFEGWIEVDNLFVRKDIVIKKGSYGNKYYVASWQPILYNISYELNNGSFVENSIDKYSIESEVKLSVPTRKGYVFRGWYDNEEFNGNQITNIRVGNYGDKVYYAKWEKVTYSISYELDGGTLEGSVLEYTIDDSFDLNVPVKNGYEFDGWYLDSKYVNGPIAKLEEGSTENKVYYAKWNKMKSYDGMKIYDVVKDNAYLDNEASLFVSNEKGIQFGNVAGITNGLGAYIVSDTMNNDYPIHYYRGEVQNNNVLFAGFCWKIVRTTETGGTKLVYSGVPTNGVCNSTGSDTQLASTKYNSTSNSISSGGYSYGKKYTMSVKKASAISVGTVFAKDVSYENGTYVLKDKYVLKDNSIDSLYNDLKDYHYTCLSTADTGCTSVRYVYYVRKSDKNVYYITLSNNENIDNAINNALLKVTNTNKSTIRVFIDKWYESNLLAYENYFEDTIWCNDRSIYKKSGFAPNGELNDSLQFGGYGRVVIEKKPSYVCPNDNDKFTVSTSNGNGILEYPVGLLTIDEVAMSGYVWFDSNSYSYLNTGKIWWMMSPGTVVAANTYMFVAYSMLDHVQSAYVSGGAGGVRPSVSLKYDVRVKSGTGSVENPFVLEEIVYGN